MSCSDIAAYGLYDYSSTQTTAEYARSIVNWFRQHQFSSYHEASSVGASVGIPVDAIMVSFGFSSSEENWSAFELTIEQYASDQTYSNSTFNQIVHTINQGVIQVVAQCQMQRGVHAFLATTPKLREAILSVHYTPFGQAIDAQIEITTLDPVTLSGPPKFKLGPGGEKTLIIKRSNDDAFNLVINSNISIVEGNKFSLPAIKPPQTSHKHVVPKGGEKIPFNPWTDGTGVSVLLLACPGLPKNKQVLVSFKGGITAKHPLEFWAYICASEKPRTSEDLMALYSSQSAAPCGPTPKLNVANLTDSYLVGEEIFSVPPSGDLIAYLYVSVCNSAVGDPIAYFKEGACLELTVIGAKKESGGSRTAGGRNPKSAR